MTIPYRILTRANREYLNSIAFYESRLRGLGHRFAAAVRKQLGEIDDDPLRWPIEEEDVRGAKVPLWKFVIHYRFLADAIVDIAIFHTSRDPQEWMDRV